MVTDPHASLDARSAILTLDVGLTNCKASLFNLQGQCLGFAASSYATYNPQTGWSEQDPDEWWKAIRKCTRTVLAHPGCQRAEILAISTTAHMHGLIAIDRQGNRLTRCWTLFDRRAETVIPALYNRVSQGAAYQITGGRLEAYTPAAKIFWLQRNLPDLFARTDCFLAPKDLIRHLLGGEIVTDPIDAAGTLLYNLRSKSWSDELLAAVGIRADQLPRVTAATSFAGSLSPAAARQLGLKAGIPLLTGAGDDVEALGAGVIHPGQVLEHIGTTGTLIACTDQYLIDDHQAVELYPHAIPGLYLVGGATNAAGRSLNWATRLLYAGQRKTVELPLIYPDADPVTPRPVYLPFILGERGLLWDGQATGQFLGLRESHTQAELARAVYEGVGFSLREILEAVKGLGLVPTRMISGSSHHNLAWGRLRADIYQMTLHFPKQPDLTGMGAAMLGMVALGVYSDLPTAAARCCSLDRQVEPDPERSGQLDRQWARYQTALRLGQASLPLFYPEEINTLE